MMIQSQSLMAATPNQPPEPRALSPRGGATPTVALVNINMINIDIIDIINFIVVTIAYDNIKFNAPSQCSSIILIQSCQGDEYSTGASTFHRYCIPVA